MEINGLEITEDNMHKVLSKAYENIQKNKPITNILIIGNGFDLACGLKTKYTDFLDRCKSEDFKKGNNLGSNIWCWYFLKLQEKNLTGENWIDFESEISTIIKSLDEASENLDNTIEFATNSLFKDNSAGIFRNKLEIFNNLLTSNIIEYEKANTLRLFRTRLFGDLQKLIMALEIYLLEIEQEEIQVPQVLKDIDPIKILSFNYTHTSGKIYNDMEESVCYIHGECRENSTIDSNDMVLGIDEYWKDEKKNSNTNYVIFKKYVQRIQKNSYVDILKFFNNRSDKKMRMTSEKCNEYNFYDIHIYGHSLDITDNDILKIIFDIETNIKIYHLDKPTQGAYIANVVKIIGKDKLIERVNNGTIKFIEIEINKESEEKKCQQTQLS